MFSCCGEKPKYVLATDLDGTLVGCQDSLIRLNQFISDCRPQVLLIYNTGRTLASAMQLIRTENLLDPDVLITDVGTEIHMGPSFISDEGWESRVSSGWNRSEIETAFSSVEGLIPQAVTPKYRLAYTTQKSMFAVVLSQINTIIETCRLPIEVVSSLEHIIDVLPEGAGKGPALSFVQKQIGLGPEQIIVCGDSGNDLSMFTQGFRGIVVGNACPAFQRMLTGGKNTYRSPHAFAAGIMDGLGNFGIMP